MRLPTLLLLGLLSACGGRPYVYQPLESVELVARAERQVDGGVRVSASVPGADETEAIFGVPLYEQGIQPVWLQVENGSDADLRYAPVGTDRFYFSALEVAWKHRGGFSDDGKLEMEKRFHELTMDRNVPAGETRSGFVFTHARPGAKDVNVDLLSPDNFYYFTFLLRVPGFIPDYANVDFKSIYKAKDVADLDETGLRAALSDLPCCSGETAADTDGDPINIILIGEGKDILYALLRARWVETSGDDASDSRTNFFFGRSQDAIFRYGGSAVDDGSYDLRLWMAPMLIEGKQVWMGQLKHIIDHRWIVRRPDPDVDNAREFMLQNLWYSQSLLKFAWIAGDEVVPVESWWLSFRGDEYFTDGFRGVFWISGDPVSLLETMAVDWDELPFE